MAHLPRALGYSLKSFWRAGFSEKVEHDGRWYNVIKTARLLEPFHIEGLVWLHGQQPGEVMLVMGTQKLRHAMRLAW